MYIELVNITKTIAKHSILNNISLSLERGNCYGFIGQNGCGKTMLLRAICGFIRPDSGEVLVNQKRIGTDCEFVEDAGVIIGEATFQDFLTGYENLKILAEIKNVIGDDEIYETLKRVQLFDVKDKKFRTYSVGMKQRLCIAQAIMENPSLLVLDEPFNGLDKQGSADIRELLLQYKQQGKTILITSHNEKDIELLCDTVIELDNGEVI